MNEKTLSATTIRFVGVIIVGGLAWVFANQTADATSLPGKRRFVRGQAQAVSFATLVRAAILILTVAMLLRPGHGFAQEPADPPLFYKSFSPSTIGPGSVSITGNITANSTNNGKASAVFTAQLLALAKTFTDDPVVLGGR